MNKLRFMKIIVFLLTFLIIFGMVLAGYAIYRKTHHSDVPSASSAIVNPAKEIIGAVINSASQNSSVNLKQPTGSRIGSVQISGNMLYILVTGGRLSDRIIILNQFDLSPITTINLH